jgi:hypothetical protein
MKRLEESVTKIHKAEELMLEGSISGEDFRRIKDDTEMQINILGEQITVVQENTANIERYSRRISGLLGRLHEIYTKVNTLSKRQIIDFLFSEKIVFEFNRFMPSGLSVAASIVYGKNMAFAD